MDRFAQMERIKQGDQEAFREIFAAYNMPVYQFALSKTNDTQKARDIVKYVFSTAYETLKKEPYYGEFSAWFQTLAELKLSELQTIEAYQEKLQKTSAKKAKRAGKQPQTALPQAAQTQAAQQQAVQQHAVQQHAAQNKPLLKKENVPFGAILVQVLFIIIRIALMGCLIWAIIGMLRALQVVSVPDWGYTWFNGSVFELF